MTKPYNDLLPLPLDSRAEPFMTLYYNALHELVCFGTHMVVWNLEQGKGRENERNEISLAPVLLFRHILELLDAISVQVKVGIVVPCKVQLRAMLEAYMSLEYMLEKDRNRRAACFLLVDHYRKLNFFKRLSHNTPESKKLFSDLSEYGEHFKNITPIEGLDQAHKNQESLIQQPIYTEARKDYLTRTNQNAKNLDIKWYALFDGPTSVKWLATKLKKYDIYEFFYKSWSDPTHGTNLSSKVIVRGEEGTGAIVQLRNMEEAHEIVNHAITFTLLIFDLVARKVVSEHKKEYATWFFEYRDKFRIPADQNKIVFNKS